jgi:hypothetical protein
LAAGFPEEALTQMLHVYSDALERVAEAEARLFHFYVHGRLKSGGLSGSELVDTTRAAQERLTPLAEPAILYVRRKGVARAAREDAVLHLAEDAGLLAGAEFPGKVSAAIAFIDLSSFTPLAEARGDVTATQVLARFSMLVREEVKRWDGRGRSARRSDPSRVGARPISDASRRCRSSSPVASGCRNLSPHSLGRQPPAAPNSQASGTVHYYSCSRRRYAVM